MKASGPTTLSGPDAVVGLGASAGGVEAIRAFLSELPQVTNLAYILALHLEQGGEDNLIKALKSASLIPVVPIGEGGVIEPDKLYIAPG